MGRTVYLDRGLCFFESLPFLWIGGRLVGLRGPDGLACVLRFRGDLVSCLGCPVPDMIVYYGLNTNIFNLSFPKVSLISPHVLLVFIPPIIPWESCTFRRQHVADRF